MATRLVVIMIAMRIGPRDERKPTPSEWVVVSAVLRGVPLACAEPSDEGRRCAVDGGQHGTHVGGIRPVGDRSMTGR
jgi:hypothetical protein